VKIPKVLYLRSFPYTVTQVDWIDPASVDAGKNPLKTQVYYGTCNSETQEITIRKDLSPERKAVILIHEMIHALTDDFARPITERQIHDLSHRLYDAITRNKLEF